MWLLFAVGSAFFAGVMSILAKVGIKDTDSDLATALRTVVVLVFAWLMVFVVGAQREVANVNARSLLFLVLSGLATGGSWLCYFKALQLGDVTKVAPIDKSSTVLTMLLSLVFLGEGWTWLKVVSMILIGAGSYLMVYEKRDAAARGEKKRSSAWLIYAILSAVFASLTAILGKIGIENVESNVGTAIRTGVVLIMAWAIVLGRGKQKGIRDIDGRSWLFIGFSGLATGLSWLCYYRALQLGPASVVVPIDKLSILITVAFGYFALKEKLRPTALIGLGLIVAGTMLLLIKT